MLCLNNNEFTQLVKYMKTNFGINLEQKRILIEGRLANMLEEKGFDNFSDYFDYAVKDTSGDEITSMINRLTTNYTYFMREINHFNYFQDNILPYLENNNKDKDLRIWSAGCSSGEEPYTVEMLLYEYFGDEKNKWNTKILATDISAKVLESAKNGIYTAVALEELPKIWRLKYFEKVDAEHFQVKSEVRNELIFRTFNLMEPVFPFKKKFHVIFCRNVMIYFDNKTKMELVNKFYEYTEPGGYLFIGHSESINKDETRYQYVMPAIYRKG